MRDGIDVLVGRRLKARRRLLGITQKGLAAYCGVTFQQVQKYESAVSRISATMLWRLACVLDVEVSYFFSGISRDPPPVQAKPQVAANELDERREPEPRRATASQATVVWAASA